MGVGPSDVQTFPQARTPPGAAEFPPDYRAVSAIVPKSPRFGSGLGYSTNLMLYIMFVIVDVLI